jgi:alpha-tubulin suppressor-like RCC1 family protein
MRPFSLQPQHAHAVTSYKHTLAMTETGAVFSCGCNAQGQLGIKSSSDRVIFERIPYLQKEDIVSIAAGARHRLSSLFVKGAVLLLY